MEGSLSLQPVRYVFTAHKSPIFLKENNTFKTITKYIVDFEVACDLLRIDNMTEQTCIPNPHVVNIREPWVQGDELGIQISHSVILTDGEFETLMMFTNTNVSSRKYTGVVEGFAIDGLKKMFPDNMYANTGILLVPDGLFGLRKPTRGFSETKHKRYVQASESFKLKAKKVDRKTNFLY